MPTARTHPSQVLREKFLALTALADAIDLPVKRIREIVRGSQAMTAGIASKLADILRPHLSSPPKRVTVAGWRAIRGWMPPPLRLCWVGFPTGSPCTIETSRTSIYERRMKRAAPSIAASHFLSPAILPLRLQSAKASLNIFDVHCRITSIAALV